MIHSTKQALLALFCATIFLGGCLSSNDVTDSLYQANLSAPITIDGSFESYNGNKKPAVLNKTNTLNFVDFLYPTVSFGNQPYSQTSASTSRSISGLLKHPKAILAAALTQTTSDTTARRDFGIYDFKHCLFKGTSKQLNSVAKHTHQKKPSAEKITARYTVTNCQPVQNITLDGDINLLNQNTTGNEINRYQLSFNNLTIHDDGQTYHYSGTIESASLQGKQIIKTNLHRIDLANNTQQYLKDLVWVDGKIDQLGGRVYDGNNGFVTLRSSEDLVLDSSGIPTDGRLYLYGKDYGDAFLAKPKGSFYGSVHVEIDEEGDGFNEFKIEKNVIYKTSSQVYSAR